MKFGGSSLKDPKSLLHIAGIIRKFSFSRRIVVLSAIGGVTDKLIGGIHLALEDEEKIEKMVGDIRDIHETLLGGCIPDKELREQARGDVDNRLEQLDRLLKGIAYTGEVTPRVYDQVVSLGEKMSVHIMTGTLRAIGVKAEPIENDSVGLIGHGPFGHGTADLPQSRKNLHIVFKPLFKSGTLPVVTGYFGQTEAGETITFGRGGSDYVAALFAEIFEAERLEVWKDVDGFLSGSPEMVESGQFISNLSYEEAAELSYFGAKILHPRTVEPLLVRQIPIVIRNTFKPDAVGTWIGRDKFEREGVVKSVTFDRNMAMIRLYGADVGYAIGLLSTLVNELKTRDINIRSVLTSQTCINILLDRRDVQAAHAHLKSVQLDGVEGLEPISNISLVAVVGEGLIQDETVVARAIQALASVHIHAELIISGASKVAAYFIVREDRLKRAVQAVHQAFFDDLREL